jgi:acetoin utilization protein AcuB
MTRQVVTVERDASLRRARRIMDNNRIRHLPVMEKGKLIGLITDRDIRAAAPSSAASMRQEDREEFLDHLQVGHVMTKKLITVTPQTTIEEAALMMRRHKIGCLPVLEGEELVGIITETDIFGIFIEVMGLGEKGSRLEIALDPRPGFVADVARILDQQQVRLLSLITVPRREGGPVVLLRVDAQDPTPLTQALEQAGYAVVSVQ